MKIEMKRPNVEMAKNIETMLNDFAKISTIAHTLKTQVVTVYRYAAYLKYTKALINDVEMKMIIDHRKARKAAALTNLPQPTPSLGVIRAATPVLKA